jgi:hypothetical protein
VYISSLTGIPISLIRCLAEEMMLSRDDVSMPKVQQSNFQQFVPFSRSRASSFVAGPRGIPSLRKLSIVPESSTSPKYQKSRLQESHH